MATLNEAITDAKKIKAANKFLIIVTGYNCERDVLPCYESLCIQEATWHAVFCNDGSTDGTGDEIKKCNVISFSSEKNMGAAHVRYQAIHQYGLFDDIVLLIGMDDKLLPGALKKIETEYEKGKLMTYGNWKDYSGALCGADLVFTKETHANRDYRKVTYRSTAPNTFRKFLFDEIPETDFQFQNEWIKSTTESPLMFACLEMCGEERIGVIQEPIYHYNRARKDNARTRMGAAYQQMIYDHVISQQKKPLYG